jgi:glycerophosphoryl diester phosphodiesterase
MSTLETPARRERVIGHRGAPKFAPENTLAGLRMAARYGARWVEFDVRLTGCGQLALMHDAELHRTTDGSGPVIAYPLQSLVQLDAGSWFAAAFSSEHVSGMSEALELCTELGMSVHVEAKSDESHAAATAQAVARVLEAVPHRDVVVSSLVPGVLVEAARLLPEVPRALGLEEPCDDWAERALALGCSAVHMDHEFLDDARLSEIAERRGDLIVRAYTVNLPDRAEELYARGIDAVFTDDPGRLLAPVEAVTRSSPRDRQRPPAA